MAKLGIAPNIHGLAILSELVRDGQQIDGLSLDELNAAIDDINRATREGVSISNCDQ